MKKLKKEHPKESLVQKLMMTVISAAVMAIVAGTLGYKLNQKLPELYYDIQPLKVVGNTCRANIDIYNLGFGLATELIIRYSFDQKIIALDYNYPEGLDGKLPKSNVSGGVRNNELLLSVPRLLPEEKIEATFLFDVPEVDSTVKVFSKEVMAIPYSQRNEKKTKLSKTVHSMSVVMQSIAYKLKKPLLNIPVFKVENFISLQK